MALGPGPGPGPAPHLKHALALNQIQDHAILKLVLLMANGQIGRSGQLATKHVDLETEPGPGPVLTLLLWALEQIAKVMLTTLSPAKFRYAQLMVPGQTGQSGAHVLKPVVVVPEPGPGHAITLPQLVTDWTVGL